MCVCIIYIYIYNGGAGPGTERGEERRALFFAGSQRNTTTNEPLPLSPVRKRVGMTHFGKRHPCYSLFSKRAVTGGEGKKNPPLILGCALRPSAPYRDRARTSEAPELSAPPPVTGNHHQQHHRQHHQQHHRQPPTAPPFSSSRRPWVSCSARSRQARKRMQSIGTKKT